MVIIPPLLPEIPLTGEPFARAPGLATSKIERERLSKKLQLYFTLRKNRVPGVRANVLPVRGREVTGRVRAPGAPIVAGFYVTWDDNSLDALLHHADDLDWVVCECAWLGPNGHGLRLRIDRRVAITIASAVPDVKQRPQIFLMVSNFDSASQEVGSGGAAPSADRSGVARARAQAADGQRRATMDLGGVTIDFEEEPQELTEPIASFVAESAATSRADGEARHAGRVGERQRSSAHALRPSERLPLSDALRRALRKDGRSGADREPAMVRRAHEAHAALRARAEGDPDRRRVRLRLERRRQHDERAAAHLPGDHVCRAKGGQEGAALRFDDAQSVCDVDRSRLHRSSRVVSRRDHRLQPDGRSAGDRHRRDGHLAHGIGGSRDLARDRQDRARFIGHAAERDSAGIRRRDGRERRDPRSVRVAGLGQVARCASIR